MKRVSLFLLLAVLFGMVLPLSATPPDRSWFTDYSRAQKEAREKKLPMFLLFTGSDWCPWCVKLNREILKNTKFKSAVKDKAVLVYLDFPRRQKLPKVLVEQNNELRDKYQILGYPTIIVTDAEGNQLGTLGYAKIDDFLPALEAVLEAPSEAPQEYLTDFAKAKQLAAEKKLPIVALFTGSDWCPWCVKLKKETLDTAEAKSYLADKAVFLYLDFPNRKPLPAALQKQNNDLAKQYKVSGFPTTVVMDAQGRELGRMSGFLPAKEYLKQIQKFAKEK